jgi:hypothetical protein
MSVKVGKVLTLDDVKKVAHPAYPYMLPEMRQLAKERPIVIFKAL